MSDIAYAFKARGKRQEARGKRVSRKSASKKTVPDQHAFGEQLNNQTTCNLGLLATLREQPNNL
ncbi:MULTISPECIES: hypothetical protein [unclassified Moorena]|uniref:hypothetical protein n=1 Tax=unclassified Moorena TaxID=2683338 RepID=UPI0013CDA3B9|nr:MULTISPECIES: hypothetical protein [unclassified Moorena]NEO18014.1 hypothetical protein [Moorena sp. SIO4A5]NEQ61338.1 hypothetical protein [Moorena sp. SIO4A1]